MAISDWARDYFQEDPSAAYFSYQDQWKTPNQKKYFQSQFENIQKQFLGTGGLALRTGQKTDDQFIDFLGKFGWGQNFNQQTQQERGQDNSRYNPWTRWMV